MCGLVGLVQRHDPRARLDLAELTQAEAGMAAWDIAASEAAPRLLAVASALEGPSRALVGWGGFSVLREEPSARTRVAALAKDLDEAAAAVDALLEQGRIDSCTGEALAQAAVAVRDLSWRLAKDALPNVEATEGLLPAGASPGSKGWFELWRLNLIFNQLERLEVRGRDSGGLATLVGFDADRWDALRDGLPDELRDDLDRRRRIDCLRDGAVLLSRRGASVVLAFAHKVAREVGELGANVRELRGKVRADLAQHRCELEAVARQPGREHDLFVFRVAIHHEVLVGRHGVEADVVLQARARRAGYVARQVVEGGAAGAPGSDDDAVVAHAGRLSRWAGSGSISPLVITT